jgi:hypothetical protein
MNVGLAAVVTATASPTPVGPATAAVTALQVVTLVIALLGLIVSVVALTWQLVEHRLTGSRVKVQVLAGALGDGGAVTGPLEKFNHELLVRAGLRRPVVGVQARNVGRLAVDVTGWSVKTDDGLPSASPVG